MTTLVPLQILSEGRGLAMHALLSRTEIERISVR